MREEKNKFIAMLLLSFFVFITAIFSVYFEMQISSGYICRCSVPLWIFIPFIASLGLLVGFVTYSLVKMDKKSEEKIDKIVDKLVVDPDERKVIKLLIKREKISQNEIVKLTELNKVKVHRILKKLELMGFISKEKKGKIAVIRIVK